MVAKCFLPAILRGIGDVTPIPRRSTRSCAALAGTTIALAAHAGDWLSQMHA